MNLPQFCYQLHHAYQHKPIVRDVWDDLAHELSNPRKSLTTTRSGKQGIRITLTSGTGQYGPYEGMAEKLNSNEKTIRFTLQALEQYGCIGMTRDRSKDTGCAFLVVWIADADKFWNPMKAPALSPVKAPPRPCPEGCGGHLKKYVNEACDTCGVIPERRQKAAKAARPLQAPPVEVVQPPSIYASSPVETNLGAPSGTEKAVSDILQTDARTAVLVEDRTCEVSQAQAKPPYTIRLSPSKKFVPNELKSANRWVLWKREERNGKMTKPPYSPRTGRRASTTEASTWGSYEQALARYKAGGYDGLGFVLGDGWVGIDLDHCVKDGVATGEAARIVIEMATYAEVSPSTDGIHILARGHLPGPGGKQPGIEMYDEARYFTVTGSHIGENTQVEERSEQLAVLYARTFPSSPPVDSPRPASAVVDLSDSQVVERAARAANGSRFSLLMAGSWKAAGYTDQSRADLALCSILAFWCHNDPIQVERIFKQSNLYRPKWDEIHYQKPRQTYGQHTVSVATSQSRMVQERVR